MRHLWTIRGRTALVFAVASMALTTAVLVFVNVASQASFSRTLEADADADGVLRVVEGTATAPASGVDSLPVAPDPSSPPPDGSTVSIIAQVSVLQWQWSAVGIVATGVLAGLVGWWVSRRMLLPIDRITDTTTRISASNLHERIALHGPDDELRRLSSTIDALLGRLETAFESQRRFVAQASHELRTPLAVQRAAIQIGLQDGTADIAATREELLAQNRRTEHLVESLLVLAQADRGLDERRRPLDLAELADRSASDAADAAGAAGVTLTCTTPSEPPRGITGEPVLVRQLLVNLLDNAIEYNVRGGHVRLAVTERSVIVENSGTAVPADVVERLVEPFRRHGDGGTRRHSGLGLSIVAAVVRAHGWDLHVVPRDSGGLVVRVDVSPM